MNISNVDWQIASACNRDCAFCFGPSQEEKPLDTKTVFSIIDLFHAMGVKQVGITGGEPLLRLDIDDILYHIKDKGMLIYLSTNCDFYNAHKTIIKETVSILGVPLDGSSDKMHGKHRGAGNFASVISTLNDLQGHNVKLKIGTVITKYNYEHLRSIERIISEHDEALLYWKLYDMIIYEKNRESSIDMFVNPDNYMASIGLLGNFLDRGKIVYHSLEKRDSSYFLIRPNGDVFVPQLRQDKSREIVLGNLINTSIDIIEDRWCKYINADGYMQTYRFYSGGSKI